MKRPATNMMQHLVVALLNNADFSEIFFHVLILLSCLVISDVVIELTLSFSTHRLNETRLY